MGKIVFFSVILSSIISFHSFSNTQPISAYTLEKVVYTAYSSIPSLVVFSRGREITLSEVTPFLATYFEDGTMFSLKLIDRHEDALGYVHYRYQQLQGGIPVTYAYYNVHTKAQRVVSMQGQLFDRFESKTNRIDRETVIQKACDYVSAERYMWQDEAEVKLVKRQTGNEDATFSPRAELVYFVSPSDLYRPATLAYTITIYASKPLSKQAVFIDASQGTVLFSENLLHFKDVKGVGHTVYSGVQTITTDSTGTGYVLRETGRGNGIETYNLKNSTNFSAAVDFTDKNNVWDTSNVQKDQFAIDAHWGAEKTYDYYFEKHGRNSIDDKGYKLVNMVHYGTSFGNAYWDGTRMVLGDGDGVNTKNPLVSLDIIGHEITHGITSNTAKLVLQNESGALNESFSDIFGATIDWYARPDKANWKVGDEISSIFRSLEDPSTMKHPDTYEGENWAPLNGSDFGGIHSNNGVQNFWYYLLVQGGAGTNDKGNVYSVKGIGIEKAAAIAYRNLTVYMTSLSNFQDARFYAIQSAIDLYGSCSQEVESVTNAWYAVGVGESYIPKVEANFTASYGSSCRALKVNFTNRSSNAISYRWDFGDNTFSTDANPSHVYSAPGQFSVKLVARSTNVCGSVDSMMQVDLVNVYPYNGEPIKVQVCSNDTILKLTTSVKNPVWFLNDSTEVVLHASKIFEIKNPRKDTNFFIGSLDEIRDTSWKVGETNVTTNISSYAATVRYQLFDVFKPLTIASVLVNAYSAGDRIIELRDASGKVLLTKTVTIPLGVSRVNLDFDVDPGIDYQLGLGGTIGNLGRSNAGINYPYVINNVLSIKASNAVNAGLQYYYSFYDWEVVSKGCKDARQEYQVKQTTCATSGVQTTDLTGVTVFPNPTTGKVQISHIVSCSIRLVDVLGNVLYANSAPSEELAIDMSTWARGVYLLELTDKVGAEVIRIVKE